MEQLFPFQTEEPQFALPSDLPVELIRTFPVAAMAARWPWKSDFLAVYYKYQSARLARAWPRALRSLNEARCFAIAGEQWEVESWVNELIVEAIAKREARRR